MAQMFAILSALVSTASRCGLLEHDRRSLILWHLPADVVARLPLYRRPVDQFISDVLALEGIDRRYTRQFVRNCQLLCMGDRLACRRFGAIHRRLCEQDLDGPARS